MSLTTQLEAREEPIRVGVIGSGIFGSQVIYAAEQTPGMTIAAIADINSGAAKNALKQAGVPNSQTETVDSGSAATTAIDEGNRAILPDGELLINAEIDVVIDATGVPEIAAKHAFQTLTSGTHFVNVSVEADTLVGPILGRIADANNVCYSLAYGDQPAQIVRLCDWATATGLEIVAAGRTSGTVEPHGTPDDSLERHSWIGPFMDRYDPDPKIYNSFLDGTKIAVESCAAANATNLEIDTMGMHAPETTIDDLPNHLRPSDAGGLLSQTGVIDAINPTGQGLSVFVITTTTNQHHRDYLESRSSVPTSDDGTYQVFTRPFHVAPETTVSIASVALRNEPTGTPVAHRAEVVGAAKRDLSPGEELDGGGGYTAYGVVERARVAESEAYVPLELLEGAELTRSVEQDQVIRYDDVELADSFIGSLRRIQDDTFDPV